MTQYYALLLISGAVVIGTGLVARPLRDRWIASVPMVAVALGAAVGPHGLALLHLELLSDPHRFMEEAARLALAMALMAAALRLPVRLSALWRAAGLVLLILMPAMWLSSAAVAWLMLDVSVLVALLLGAILSPTDPVLAGAIVTGRFARRNVPGRLRHLLSAEAAANDGLALLFVLLPIKLLTLPTGEALFEWVAWGLVWEVAIGAILGWAMGMLIGRGLGAAVRRKMTERMSLLTIAVAATLVVLMSLRLSHADGILGVFMAGIAFSRVVNTSLQKHAEEVQDIARTLIELPVFVILGILLPIDQWLGLGWPALGFAVAILFLRRLPWMWPAAAASGFFRSPREILFAGWFGPVGIAAVFYALYAVRATGEDGLWPITSLVVFVSLVIHGITAKPGSERLTPSGIAIRR